jgi:predicted nucleic acid-binding protein
MSTPRWTSASMSEATTGLLDTSVVIDHDLIDVTLLPDSTAIAAITLAELAAGPHATNDMAERARRQDRLQWASATWDPLPFDAECARAFGRLYAAMRVRGRSPRARVADLLIAATAVAHGLPVYTRNPADLQSLRSIINIVAV